MNAFDYERSDGDDFKRLEVELSGMMYIKWEGKSRRHTATIRRGDRMIPVNDAAAIEAVAKFVWPVGGGQYSHVFTCRGLGVIAGGAIVNIIELFAEQGGQWDAVI